MTGAPTADRVSKSRFKRVAKRCLVVFVSVVALLSVAELTLRGIGYSYRLYPEKVEFGWPKPTTIKEMFAPDPDLFWVPRVPTPYPNILDKARTDRDGSWKILGDGTRTHGLQRSLRRRWTARKRKLATSSGC